MPPHMMPHTLLLAAVVLLTPNLMYQNSVYFEQRCIKHEHIKINEIKKCIL